MARARLLFLVLSSLLVMGACSDRRGGGGDRGGDDDDAGGDDDDAVLESGPGRNVGDTTEAGTVTVGDGDGTLFVVNLRPGVTVGDLIGRSCDGEPQFEESIGLSEGEHTIVEGLTGGCWWLEIYVGFDQIAEQVIDDLGDEYTLVVSVPDGDDDDSAM